MKTIFTFLFCFLISLSAFAESQCASLFLNLDAKTKILQLDQGTKITQNGFGSLIQILESGSPKEQKAVRNALNKISLTEISTPFEVQSAVIRLYKIANTPSKNPIKTLTEDITSIERRIIKKRIELEILQTDIFSALQNLGLMKKLSKVDKARLRLNGSISAMELVSSSIVNNLTYYWLSIFGSIPAIQISEFQRIKPELIRKVREEGFDAVYPELLRVFKNKAKVDIVFMAAARTYTLYIMLLVPQMVYENYSMIKFGIGMATMTEQSLRAYEQEHFNAAEVRTQRFEAWRGGYEAFNGKLDETNPLHAKLMNDKILELKNIKDEDLKIFK